MVEEEKEVIDPDEELRKVPGIGAPTATRLEEVGYKTIKAVASASPEELEPVVGARSSEIVAAAKEMVVLAVEEEEVVEEVKVPEVAEEVPEKALKKEQGPFLDLIDKITEKDTTLHVEIEDVGGRLFGRSLKLAGKIRLDMGTLKEPRL